MAPILVLLANLSPTVREVVEEAFADQSDIRVVGKVSDSLEVLLAVGRAGAEVVIVGTQDTELPGVASHLLDQYPHVKILAIGADSRRVFLYELRPQLVPMGEMDPRRLVHTIRTVTRSEPL